MANWRSGLNSRYCGAGIFGLPVGSPARLLLLSPPPPQPTGRDRSRGLATKSPVNQVIDLAGKHPSVGGDGGGGGGGGISGSERSKQTSSISKSDAGSARLSQNSGRQSCLGLARLSAGEWRKVNRSSQMRAEAKVALGGA